MLNTAIAEMGAVTTFTTEVDRLLADNKKLRDDNVDLLLEVSRLREQLRQREAAQLPQAA